MEYHCHAMHDMGHIAAALLGVILFHKDYDKMQADFWDNHNSPSSMRFASRHADHDRADWLNIVRDELGWQWEELHAMCGAR